MALHPLKLPKSAALLFRIVVLQKRLLKALADPALVPASVNIAWVQNVWNNLEKEWVRKFCLRGQEARIRFIAAETPTARQALYDEFRRQNKVPSMIGRGGSFCDLHTLPDFNAALVKTVTEFFKDCYELLGQASRTKGYTITGHSPITKRLYNQHFRESFPTKVVCPYCDGEMGTADLDHYYSKSHFPLLACSPWNLIPICKSCNDATVAKGDRIALTVGPPCSTTDWLHPFMRPASEAVLIRLTGSPREAVPELYSPDADEQRCLRNHVWLMDRLDDTKPYRYLSDRWTRAASAHYDVLVRIVNTFKERSETATVQRLVQIRLEDHEVSRGRSASALVHAAVCRAILDQRPEYLEEFANANPVRIEKASTSGSVANA